MAGAGPRVGQVTLATDPAPFEDTAFVSRLQKLLSMLGSEQPGEADVARRKLVEHLGNHRLSLTELGARLRAPPAAAPRPSFGGAEMGLDRQLYLARVARQEAEADTQRARQRITELSRSLQEAQVDFTRALQGQARTRLLALAGWLLAAGAGLLLWNHQTHAVTQASSAIVDRPASQAVARPADPEDGQALHAAEDERPGTVLVQDLPVRLSPNDNGEVRAFLNRGTHVLIGRQTRVGVQTWLLIRTVTGSGWVRSGDVLH